MPKINGKGHPQSGITSVSSEFTPPKKGKKRHLTAVYKLRMLAEIDELPYGEIGSFLRQRGLYSSQIATWRKQRETGQLAGLTPKKRGPEVNETRKPAKKITLRITFNNVYHSVAWWITSYFLDNWHPAMTMPSGGLTHRHICNLQSACMIAADYTIIRKLFLAKN